MLCTTHTYKTLDIFFPTSLVLWPSSHLLLIRNHDANVVSSQHCFGTVPIVSTLISKAVSRAQVGRPIWKLLNSLQYKNFFQNINHPGLKSKLKRPRSFHLELLDATVNKPCVLETNNPELHRLQGKIAKKDKCSFWDTANLDVINLQHIQFKSMQS